MAEGSAPLTPKQISFIQAYQINPNATAAAIEAGYSRHTAEQQGYQLLRKPAVAAAVAEAEAERAKRTEITGDRIIAELASIAFANMGDLLRRDSDGNVVVD